MIVAVSMGVFQNPSYVETRDTLSHDWISFLDHQGVTPLLVPNNLAEPGDYCRRLNVSGILLTSGNDVGLQPGEQWAASADVSEERDRTECALLHYSVENGIPLLGVCRGMQMINGYFGGTLVRDLMAWTNGEQHVASDHSVEIVDPAYRKVLGVDGLVTNSYHNHGVTRGTVAPCLEIIAVTKAGVVEALYHPGLPLLGTQWHPERISPEPRAGTELFRQWLVSCADYANAHPSEPTT